MRTQELAADMGQLWPPLGMKGRGEQSRTHRELELWKQGCLTGTAAVEGQGDCRGRGDGWSRETWHKRDSACSLLALNLSLVLPIGWTQWEVTSARDSG